MDWGAAGAVWEPLAEGPRVPRGSSCSALLLWETRHRALRLWWSWRGHTLLTSPKPPLFVCLSFPEHLQSQELSMGRAAGAGGQSQPWGQCGCHTWGQNLCQGRTSLRQPWAPSCLENRQKAHPGTAPCLAELLLWTPGKWNECVLCWARLEVIHCNNQSQLWGSCCLSSPGWAHDDKFPSWSCGITEKELEGWGAAPHCTARDEIYSTLLTALKSCIKLSFELCAVAGALV